jgi:hypothetical protein
MPRPAKILLVGTCAATALFAGAASSQTRDDSAASRGRVVNGQLQIGDIFAGQRLNVIDPADGVGAWSGANGNSLEASAQDRDLRVRSVQTVEGRVGADTNVTVHGWSPQTTALSAAVGNSAQTGVHHGSVRAQAEQLLDVDASVEARTRVTARPSSSMDTSATALAFGNDQAHTAHGERAVVRAGQFHYGQGASARVDASLAHVKGRADLLAAAGSNQLTVTADTDAVRVRGTQVATGSTEASIGAHVPNGYLVNGLSSAAANSVTLSNEGASTDARLRQQHEGYVRGETALYVGEFGGVSAQAFAAANTVSAAASGDVLKIDTDQLNTGGVDAYASFDGQDGYDAEVHASATGNGVAVQGCSDCDGVLNGDNNQVNSGDVAATTRADVGAGARSVNATATAVGNSASYVVNRPRN